MRTAAGICGRTLGNLAVLGAVALFLLVALGPHLLGYRTATMLTGSMSPTINPGDVIVSTPEPVSQLKIGDVISYHIPVEDHRVETHRVVTLRHRADGRVVVRTQGDANPTVDPWTAVLKGQTVWRTRGVVPYVGTVIRSVREAGVTRWVFWAAMAGLVLVGLRRIWTGDRSPEPAPGAAMAGEGLAPTHLVLEPSRLEDLADQMESSEAAYEFAHAYQEMLRLRVRRIAGALEVGDRIGLLDASLSLKVSSATVGTVELAELAEVIELSTRRGDLAGAAPLVGQLPAAAQRAEQALSTRLSA